MLKVTSPAVRADGTIDQRNTYDGEDFSPAISWSGAPPGTASFAVIMDDPDAAGGTWVHWVIFDIPGSATGLPAGMPKAGSLPDGSRQGACWGVTSFNRVGYHGPCPPPGKPHRYVFKVWALSGKRSPLACRKSMNLRSVDEFGSSAANRAW